MKAEAERDDDDWAWTPGVDAPGVVCTPADVSRTPAGFRTQKPNPDPDPALRGVDGAGDVAAVATAV